MGTRIHPRAISLPLRCTIFSTFHGDKLRTEYAFKFNEAFSMNFLLSLPAFTIDFAAMYLPWISWSSSGFYGIQSTMLATDVLEYFEASHRSAHWNCQSYSRCCSLTLRFSAFLKWRLDYLNEHCNNFTSSLNFKHGDYAITMKSKVSSTDSRFVIVAGMKRENKMSNVLRKKNICTTSSCSHLKQSWPFRSL